MKQRKHKTILFILFTLLSQVSFAQASEGRGSEYMLYVLLAIVVLIFFGILVQVSDNLLAIESRRLGAQREGVNYGILPWISELFSKSAPEYVGKAPLITLKKGFNVQLEGEAAKTIQSGKGISTFGVQPGEFIGMQPIPKLLVQEGDTVKAGDFLFFDKNRPEIKYAAPVSGEVVEIRRGERRAIHSIVILADKEIQYRSYENFDLEKGSREELVNYLLEAGVWPLIRQRPYNLVANPADQPRDIYISTFDTAPLAPDLNLVVEGKAASFQKGLDVLSRLTKGKVHLGLNANLPTPPSPVFVQATGVEKTWFRGKHPVGNVGIQIHNTQPVAAKECVWTLGVQDVISLGALFVEKRYNAERVVAIAGAEISHPQYIRTYQGAKISDLVKDNLKNDHVRYICGDILSGMKRNADEFLNFYDDQLTVVREGDDYELFGWMVPQEGRPSVSRTYPNFLFPGRQYRASTNTRGERRAFVVTGQYEALLPMNIYPQHALKAVITGDYEGMEGLGIKEMVEEDIALCEFACTSKQPLQKILREGLDLMHAEE